MRKLTLEGLIAVGGMLCAVKRLVEKGVRDWEEVRQLQQLINDQPNFFELLGGEEGLKKLVAGTARVRIEDIVLATDVSAPKKDAVPATDWFAEMAKFYKDVFDMDVDMSRVALSSGPGGFGWALFVAQGITLNQAWAKCKERFPLSFSVYGDDLDKAVTENDRNTATGYVKRFRDRVEADNENKNISANVLKQCGVQSITLLERLLLELWYNWKTGKHLDIQNWTLCAGSRDINGNVPYVNWSDNKLRVNNYHPDNANVNIRARPEVQERNLRWVPFLQIDQPAIGHFGYFLQTCLPEKVCLFFNYI